MANSNQLPEARLLARLVKDLMEKGHNTAQIMATFVGWEPDQVREAIHKRHLAIASGKADKDYE